MKKKRYQGCGEISQRSMQLGEFHIASYLIYITKVFFKRYSSKMHDKDV